MASELEGRIIGDFAHDIARKLGEAAIIARTASGFSAQGLPERVFRTLLDIETLVHDAATLLNAMSVVRRREGESTID
jgi:hypothetical protein